MPVYWLCVSIGVCVSIISVWLGLHVELQGRLCGGYLVSQDTSL